MSDLRVKDSDTAAKYSSNTLERDESTYYFSSKQKEQEFLDAQFSTLEL